MFEVTYDEQRKVALCNGETFTRDEKTGYYLCSHRINGKRARLHRYLWEQTNGAIPQGMHIHHIDKDKYNNSIENLALLPGHEHLSIHGSDPEMKKKSRESIKKAIAAASEWHKSESGHEWHKRHYEAMSGKLYRRIERICEQCGRPFDGVLHKNKYCCNACKTRARYNSGADNETRICAVCGAAFEINKYSAAKTCGRKCAGRLRSRDMRPQVAAA
jgi:hypothetical protein